MGPKYTMQHLYNAIILKQNKEAFCALVWKISVIDCVRKVFLEIRMHFSIFRSACIFT